MTATTTRRFYRLRAPGTNPAERGVAISVRVDEATNQLYVAVGAGRRRMYLTTDEAWVLWRCLSEAMASLGEPPAHIHTFLNPTGPRKSSAS